MPKLRSEADIKKLQDECKIRQMKKKNDHKDLMKLKYKEYQRKYRKLK